MGFQEVKNLWSFTLIFIILLIVGCTTQLSNVEESESILEEESESILEKVKQREFVNCGISGNLRGFSYVNLEDIDIIELYKEKTLEDKIQKNLFGFDVDICKAIAAAIFDDPEAVNFVLLDTKDRFEAISSQEIDVLSRTTTWTVKRDISIKVEFAPIIFYDGQGLLVRKDSGIKSFSELAGNTVCVETETTNNENLEDEKKKRGFAFKIKPIQSQKDVYRLYEAGECQGVTSDRSQLAAMLNSLNNPEEHIILPEIISKEPLAPVVIDDDLEWIEIVRWVVFALIEAEELGINQTNLEQMKKSKDPQIIRFLGLEENEDSIGSRLNLSPDYTQRIIKHVGNYGDIYERNLGPDSSTPIERGLNHLWNHPEGRGLMYSPPFR